MTRVLDPVTALFRVPLPVETYSSVFMPNLAVGTTVPTFDGLTLYDVSAWESWTLFGVAPPSSGLSQVIITYYENSDRPYSGLQQSQTITVNTAGNTFLVVGRVLGPLLTVQYAGALATPGNLEFFVSNRTRLYDAPYTPAPLGQVLAAIGNQGLAANQTVTADLANMYLGPARLGMEINATNVNSVAFVRDDVGVGTQYLATANLNSGIEDLWIPNLASSAATKWRLGVFATAAASMSAALVAA